MLERRAERLMETDEVPKVRATKTEDSEHGTSCDILPDKTLNNDLRQRCKIILNDGLDKI